MNPNKWDWLREHLEAIKKCPQCSQTNWKLMFRLGILSIYRCEGCRLIFLNPFLGPEGMKKIFSSEDSLVKVSKFFSGYCEGKTWNTPRTLATYRRVLNKIGKYRPPGKKLLDVGCGRGAFLKVAKEAGWQSVGIEPNFEDAKRLKEEIGIEVLQTDFFSADLAKQEFDVVSLWDLIEHVPNPGEWAKRCYKIIKPGGLLAVATPNHFSLLDLIAFLGYRLSFGAFTYALEKLYTIDHTLYFTRKTLTDLLTGQGFVTLESIKVNTDLERYTMGPLFRFVSEILMAFSEIVHLQNRVIIIARKNV